MIAPDVGLMMFFLLILKTATLDKIFLFGLQRVPPSMPAKSGKYGKEKLLHCTSLIIAVSRKVSRRFDRVSKVLSVEDIPMPICVQ